MMASTVIHYSVKDIREMVTKEFSEITNIIESTLYNMMKIRRSIWKGQMWISAGAVPGSQVRGRT